MTEKSVRARISSGTLRGTTANGIDRYLGVPYAAAPVADLRFAPAAPHPGWQGERDATRMGATAPQSLYAGAFETLLPMTLIPGDEFLNVNIWTPADATDLPVMVWVHGGANIHGANSLDGYDGSAFARDGVVVVSINYRLGAEGFSVLDGVPLNLGLSDVVTALRWVKVEIANFGGDPENVTAFGESAGSILLGSVVAHPDARRLISRAILESGAPTAVSKKAATKMTTLVAKQLRIPATREAFAAKTPTELIEAETVVMAGGTPITGGPGYATAIGDETAPRDPRKAILAGEGDEIPLLIGSTTEEYRLWFVPLGLMEKISAPLFAAVRVRFGINGRILGAYKRSLADHSRGALFGTIATDLLIRLPINRIADSRLSRGVATWVYEFGWRSPSHDLGAAHAMEIGFAFDTLASPDWRELMGATPPQKLADEMHSAWVRFAKTGNPGWEAWNARRPVETFGSPESGIVYAPREETRAAWKK
jgi:para-nitrobenzyl esterase